VITPDIPSIARPAAPAATLGDLDLERGRLSAPEAATAVEGLFVSMLVAEMKKTLQSGGFFGDGPGSDVFDGMFERLMGEEIAKKGGFGLAAFVTEHAKAPPDERQEKDSGADHERTGAAPVTLP
jgi:Rod binding domain-containing protein